MTSTSYTCYFLTCQHTGACGQMKLFLIRHGETVDNIAGLYAGVRDSALTNHGVEQTQKLGAHLAKTGVRVTHIYASPLTRAFKTAEALQKAQLALTKDASTPAELPIVKVPALIEQDFGFYEGKPFYARSDPKKTGREAHHDNHKNDPGFVDVETKESMARRADLFLDERLLPLLESELPGVEQVVMVVSHGMLLSHLWRRLLQRLPRKSLTIAAEVMAARDNLVLEHLGGWSNTGYLELIVRKDAAEPGDGCRARTPEKLTVSVQSEVEVPLHMIPESDSTSSTVQSLSAEAPADPVRSSTPATVNTLSGYSTSIIAIDSKQHLIGLKRQRGGIGRLAHDEGQKKLDGFFKKQRKE